ncbi:MAG: hypothetical protein DRI44_06200 [Chlamydiae bacterium]|nr:MAG: hypothetical protein DRI44_06200 [Chlamydiota bacterium]
MYKNICYSILFFILVIVNSVNASNAVFKNKFGNWNVSVNWQANHIPNANDNAIIANDEIAVIDSGQNKCEIVYCGLSGKANEWGKVTLKKGGNLNVSCLVLGKNKKNHGIFSIYGGNLYVSKYLQIGGGDGNSAGSGELFLSAGKLIMAKEAPVFVGYKGKGEMIVSWKGMFKGSDLTVAESPGSQGSVLKIIGGKFIANNITVNCQSSKIPSKIIVSGGKVEWNNHFIVNDVLKIQNSSAVITAKSKKDIGLSLGNKSLLEFEFGAKGIAPINLGKSKINIASSAKLRVSGTYYTRANGKPGRFLLIKHNGYANKSIFKDVEITGFGNFAPSLKYMKKSLYLDLKRKVKTVDRSNQGIFMKYWELPIDCDGDKTVIFPPLTYMPSFTNSLVRTHPLFGKIVRKIDLSETLRGTNILAQFKGLISIPRTGKYNFWVKYNEAAQLKIDDLSIEKDKPGKLSLSLDLTNGMHKIEVGFYQNDSEPVLKVYWKGPGFSKREIPEGAFFIPNPPEKFSKFYAFGNIMPDQERIYNYCPSFLFDEEEGLYKIWSGGAEAGDFILYKEAPTLEKLESCPTLKQLYPLHNDKFDELHCCDPSVFLDANGVFYLTYSGCSDGDPLGKATRIGMAVSSDKGRSWERLHNGVHIIGPKKPEGGYGTGQSAAVRANDGYYYMIYTDADAAHKGQYLAVFKCSDPAFPKDKLIAVKKDLHYGSSVDLAYDSEKEEFIVIGDVSSDPDKTSHPYAGVRLVYFDKNWKKIRVVYLKADTSWSFGEGVALLTDMKKNPLKYSYHENDAYVFAAATQSYEGDTRLWAEWVEGDTRYLMFPIPDDKADTSIK